jgi:hypothetical protein
VAKMDGSLNKDNNSIAIVIKVIMTNNQTPIILDLLESEELADKNLRKIETQIKKRRPSKTK